MSEGKGEQGNKGTIHEWEKMRNKKKKAIRRYKVWRVDHMKELKWKRLKGRNAEEKRELSVWMEGREENREEIHEWEEI